MSNPSTNSRLIETLNVYAHKYIHAQTPEQGFPKVHKVFPELRKWVKVQGSRNQFGTRTAHASSFPDSIYLTSTSTYLHIHLFIYLWRGLAGSSVDVWNFKMLINIQMSWFYMVGLRQIAKKRIINLWIKEIFTHHTSHIGNIVWLCVHKINKWRQSICMCVSGRVITWQQSRRGLLSNHNLYQLISLIGSLSPADGEISSFCIWLEGKPLDSQPPVLI